MSSTSPIPDPPQCFVDLVLAGDEDFERIDHYVARWHATGPGVSLDEYLGFTAEEGALWAARPAAIRAILHARRFAVPLAAAVERMDDRRARRPDGSVDEKLTAWLARREARRS